MRNRLTSLIWLRSQQLISNPQYLILIFMPYVFTFIYKYLFSEEGSDQSFIVLICLPMLFGISLGNLITSTIAEEKEKNNLRGLILAGVTGIEYIISSLFFPAVLGVLGIILIPVLIGNVQFVNGYGNYLMISLITALVIALINLLIGLNVKTVNQAQIISLPIMMLTMLLPMLSLVDPVVERINEYSFMGSFAKLFSQDFNPIHTNPAFYILLIWLAIFLVLNTISFKNNLDIRVSKLNNLNKKVRVK